MATRQKKTVFTGVSQEMANDAFASYAKSDARIQKLQAEIELACAKIREKHADELSRLDAEREQAFDVLQSYALENQQELFLKKKSLEMAHGTIGFRTGTPKLKTLKGFTWGAALNLTKHILPQYIRVSEEIAKDMLIADRESEDVQTGTHNSGIPMRDALAECGMQVVQEETFYVEPKKEE